MCAMAHLYIGFVILSCFLYLLFFFLNKSVEYFNISSNKEIYFPRVSEMVHASSMEH